MGWLVFETFLLMLGFVAIGIALGIALRVLTDGFAPRPTLAPARFAPIDDADTSPVHDAHAHEAHAHDHGGAPAAAPAPARSTDPEGVVDRSVAMTSVDTAAEAPAPAAAPPVMAAGETVIDPDKAAAADQIGIRPAALARPRDGSPDDLKIIKGIGPQNEARLNALGIYHLDQIAAWSPEEARWIGSYLAFPGRIERENWIVQAKELIAGR